MESPRAIAFDLFGTLLNTDTLRADLIPVVTHCGPFIHHWRDRLLAYMLAAAAMRRYEDFDDLVAHALDYAALVHKLSLGPEYRRSLVEAWRYMHPYKDVVPALRALREAGASLAVLTNATAEGGYAALRNAGLGEFFETCLSVDPLRTYKPDPRAYELVTAHFGAAPEQVVFVTSEGWDATGAAEFGMRVAWCNRAGVPPETLGAQPTWTIGSLRDLCALLVRPALAL